MGEHRAQPCRCRRGGTVLDTITKTVAKREKVTIPGFGTFESRERSARTGRNPQTGAEIQIAASTVPGFKAGAKFKAAVSGSYIVRRPGGHG